MLKKVIYVIPLLLLLALAPVVSLAEGAEETMAKAAAVMNQEETKEEETKQKEPGQEEIPENETLEGRESGTAGAEKKPLGPASDEALRPSEKTGDESGENEAEAGEQSAPAEALPYTEEDLYVMAHVLAGECQSCPDEEQLYVGSVVLNRKNHPSFPNTVRGVVFQKGQYSCTRDGNYYREPTQRNWDNARRLLETGSILPGNVIWQSGRRQGRGVYIKTRWHYYCY